MKQRPYPPEPATNDRLNYQSAGVNTQTGDEFVDWIQNDKTPMPHQKNIVEGVGGFASLFRFQFPEMKKPCLVSCTDGVGTKVKLASHFNDYTGVGQDLVGMCVNDLICTGGRPLFFLDYYATGKLDLQNAKAFLKSVRKACDESDLALIGGETAEMPGVYHEKDFDCAGFAVGVVDEDQRWGAHKVKNKDHVFGIPSSGFHSNGYSLLRKVFEKDLDQWKDVLLTPTRLYVKMVQAIAKEVDIHAASHMTGGGIENLPRVIPDGWTWNRKDWVWPDPFQEVQKRTGMSDEEMLTSLNCGIGFCLIADESQGDKIQKILKPFGLDLHDLGQVVK